MDWCRLLVAAVLAFAIQVSVRGEPPGSKDPKRIRTDRYGDALPDGALARLGTVRFRHYSHIAALAWSPDGKMLATGGGFNCGPIRLWDVATGKEVRRFVIDGIGGDSAVAGSPDGRMLASGWDDDGSG